MFSIGADPEMFLQDADGGLVSAIGLIKGSKKEPRPLPIGDGFAVQEDNVAAEYNIPPAHNAGELIEHIRKVQTYLSEEIKQHGLSFSTLSAGIFDDVWLLHPAAREFGCDPDYNAWTGRRNPRPHSDNPNLRSCGGHVHIGYKFDTKDDLMLFMRYCDLYLGVPSTLMDTGEKRKELYGKRGAFRPKPYGGEYRVLSNFWTFEQKYIEWVWQATEQAMGSWQNKRVDVDSLNSEIADAINNNNKDTARKLVDHHNLILV